MGVLDKVLFQIPGGYDVTLITLIVFFICMVTLVVALFVIVADIKKYPGGKKPTRRERRAERKAMREDRQRALQEGAAAQQTATSGQTGKASYLRYTAAARSVAPANDPLVRLLGFDPYAPVEYEDYADDVLIDPAQETEDMRTLREKMRLAKELETRRKTLSERLDKVRGELGTTTRALTGQRERLSSMEMVGEKLQAQVNEYSIDKKSKKDNKENIVRVQADISANMHRIAELNNSIAAKASDEKLLNEAGNYLVTEISYADRDLSYIRQDVEKLNSAVGEEMQRLQNENRARTMRNKLNEIKPLFVKVNATFREINKLDEEITSLHNERYDLSTKLANEKRALQTSVGAEETSAVSKAVGDINNEMIRIDGREGELVAKKKELIEVFRTAKTEANAVLDRGSYELEAIVSFEDQVVGEIEYDAIVADYEDKKANAVMARDNAQRYYDDILAQKNKANKATRAIYEEPLAQAAAALQQAEQNLANALAEYEREVPKLSPASLVTSGSGVISKERMTKQASSAQRVETAKPAKGRRSRKQSAPAQNAYAVGPVVNQTANLQRLVLRLTELENIALKQKRQREIIRAGRAAADSELPEDKIVRRKAQVAAMRKNLKYIDSVEAAEEFKRKLQKISVARDADEMADNALSEMIRRTMNEATYLGNKAAEKGNN